MQQRIQIPRNGIELAGVLFTPENFDETKQYPAIVVVHPGGGVKEQTAGLYADKLAEAGFVAVAYDASHQGESGGEPRFLESPSARVADISYVIDYLNNLPFVDNGHIGSLGICAGGGYADNAAQIDKRIKAVANVSGIDIGWLFRDAFGEDPFPTILATFEQVAQGRSAEAQGAELIVANYVPHTSEEAAAAPFAYAREAHNYYRTPRAMCPTAENKLLVRSFPEVLSYDALRFADKLLTQPLLLIVGEQSDTAYQAESILERAASAKKELVRIEGATHVSLYDKDADKAVEKLAGFFKENL